MGGSGKLRFWLEEEIHVHGHRDWGVGAAMLHGLPLQHPFMARAGARKASRVGQYLKQPGGGSNSGSLPALCLSAFKGLF